MAQSSVAQTQTDHLLLEELKQLRLEELMELEVTSVSRYPERLSETASAIQVLTNDDIHRSAANSLPEALRLASNLQVAQVNAHDWAITARGFNGAPLANNSLADKLLVMIDGRSVYTPLFGGVFWDAQNVVLEDLDRIEVVSGPGGTLWGANAVNGVINVISKSARDTQGLFVTGGGGSFWQDFGGVRYGASIHSNLFFRVYGQRFDHNSTELPNGDDAFDDWDMTQGGFRADWYASDVDTVTLQGDAYGGNERTMMDDRTLDGQNVLARWTRWISEESEFRIQMYFDRTWRNLRAPTFFTEDLKTYDFDFQHRIPFGRRHNVIWGGGYRLMVEKLHNTPSLSFSPEDRDMHLFNMFLQDEIALIEERLHLVLGTKLEHNDFSGFEIQPNGRLSWSPVERHTFWAAVSRAVRSPARFDTDVSFPLAENNDFESEKVIAYELGYRVRPMDRLSLSLAAFFNDYDDLRGVSASSFSFVNEQRAETWGMEISGSLQALSRWRLRGGYTHLQERIWSSGPDLLPGSDNLEALDPRHQFLLQSILDLPWHIQFDTVTRYVSRIDASPLFAEDIADYFTFDARLAWQWNHWEVALVGQNLWDNHHPEFGLLEIPRSVYGKVSVRW